MTAYHYPFISDLPQDWERLGAEGLRSLAPIWQERKAELSRSDLGETAPELQKFNDRLRREWAIETGIIENLYSIDRGVTQLLIEQGFTASLMPHGSTNKPPEQIVLLLRDQEQALEHVFHFVAQKRSLTASYIKELHADLTRNQPYSDAVDASGKNIQVLLRRGQWKQQPNSPTRRDGLIHEYCPPVHVDAEIDQLISMHEQHRAATVPPEVEAAWLHHRFTQIHPFQDGNGRVARALASLIFLRAGWFPLVIHRDIREKYISALERADDGNLEPLVRLFARTQKDAFVRALSIAGDVLKEQQTRQQIIAAAGERLRDRADAKITERQRVFTLAERLRQVTLNNLQEVSRDVNTQLSQIEANYSSSVRASDAENSHYYWWQVETVALRFQYFSDSRSYRAWICLKIQEDVQTEIVVSFHSLGVKFLGVMAASAFLQLKIAEEDDFNETLVSICDEIFQFSYNDEEHRTVERFEVWLNGVILSGLDQWRRQL